jgi:hypothetical protein
MQGVPPDLDRGIAGKILSHVNLSQIGGAFNLRRKAEATVEADGA